MKNKILFFAVLTAITACDKSDDEVTGSDRNQALFGQWEYEAIMSDTAVDINGDNTVNVDLYNTNEIRQCIKDNITVFAAREVGEKNAYSLNENGLSCGEVDSFSNVESDRYELIDNEIIRFDNRNDMIIIEFTTDRLVVDQADFLDDSDVVITYTFKKR
jgi:hypothetical protein|tara:strand:- start:5066 stop:5545 length:480 start_codon:yes stop_codon:yes gene_type:complete